MMAEETVPVVTRLSSYSSVMTKQSSRMPYLIDITLPFRRHAEVTWIVGLDGSALSFRCLRLAAMLMHQSKHNLVALNLVKPNAPDTSAPVGIEPITTTASRPHFWTPDRRHNAEKGGR